MRWEKNPAMTRDTSAPYLTIRKDTTYLEDKLFKPFICSSHHMIKSNKYLFDGYPMFNLYWRIERI